MRLTCWALLCLVQVSCSSESAPSAERRAPPPPPVGSASAATACTRQEISDPATKAFFPSKIGSFCLDEDGGRAVGEGTKERLENLSDFFDGEAEVYHRHQVRRVTQFRYVSTNSSATIDFLVSKFASKEFAFAMFTKRVTGDGDPADEATAQPLAVAGAAAVGVGNANLWKGEWLFEIVYNDDKAAPEALAKAAAGIVPELTKSVAERVTGDAEWPDDVKLLPAQDQVPSGFRLVTEDAFPFAKGPGRFGMRYYAERGRRFRFARLNDTAEAAERWMKKLSGASKPSEGATVPGADQVVAGVYKDGEVEVEALAARKGAFLIVVQDEPRVLRAGATAEERAKVSLTLAEKAEKAAVLLR